MAASMLMRQMSAFEIIEVLWKRSEQEVQSCDTKACTQCFLFVCSWVN